MKNYGFDQNEFRLLRSLSTPPKIQNYLETLKANFDDTCMSPRRVMRERRAHCLEGAMLAAAALWVQGKQPLLLDLRSKRHDDDHVVALFRFRNRWGAISKTNHAVLRYREPIYQSVRELAASYFHEYFVDTGEKTLLSYSVPFNLRTFTSRHWTTDERDLWYIANALDEKRHYEFAPTSIRRRFRRADPIEIKAGKIVQWKKSRS